MTKSSAIKAINCNFFICSPPRGAMTPNAYQGSANAKTKVRRSGHGWSREAFWNAPMTDHYDSDPGNRASTDPGSRFSGGPWSQGRTLTRATASFTVTT